jgi:hypothetical protein
VEIMGLGLSGHVGGSLEPIGRKSLETKESRPGTELDKWLQAPTNEPRRGEIVRPIANKSGRATCRSAYAVCRMRSGTCAMGLPNTQKIDV